MDIKLIQQGIVSELKGRWVLWRWKGDKTWSKNFVYNTEGQILELTDSSSLSRYPTRVLYSEIDVLVTIYLLDHEPK